MTPQLGRIFVWHVVRSTRRHPLLAVLNVLSVALGVAVYLAIQIANHSANQSFAASIDTVAGKANLEARSAAGTIDEGVLPKLDRAPGVRAATPTVEGYATLPRFPGDYLQLLGVDIFSNAPFATFSIGSQEAAAAGIGDLDLDAWLGDPHGLAITDEFARQHQLKVGDSIELQVNGREHTMVVRFIMRLDQTVAGKGNSRLAALDIGWAQELLGKQGKLSSVQMILDRPRESERLARELGALVPADVTVEPPGQRSGQVERMLASFELNLGALSLISLLVGMFLIYNTIAASVVRRRVETGILRAIGATRWEVELLFLGEAALFGLIGVAVGMVGGVCLARYLLGREIARVISTLYVLVSVDWYFLSPWLIGSALFFGLGSVLAAAWLPASAGARADPVAALSLNLGLTAERSRLRAGRWLLMGVVMLGVAVGCSVLALVSGPAWLGFGSAFFVLLGFALMAPSVIKAVSGLAAPRSKIQDSRFKGQKQPANTARNAEQKRRHSAVATAEGEEAEAEQTRQQSAVATAEEEGASTIGLLINLAAQQVYRSLHRTAVIVAALMAAVAMTVGISVMIHAFRQTVEIWIDRAIVADIFMTPAANETLGNGAFFPPEVLAALRRDPAVRRVDTVREVGIRVGQDRVSMAVIDGENNSRLAFVGGNAPAKLAAFYQPETVLVSEPFAHRFHVKDGDRLPIATPDGVVIFAIAGVYYDYSRDAGIVAISRDNFLKHWHDDRVMSAAVYLKNPTEVDSVADGIRVQYNRQGQFLVYSNRAIRDKVFEIFGQTFRITGVLRGIAVVVAIIGIFLTLSTLVAEREKEIGVLRAIGASRGQIQGMLLAESALIGGLASVLGMVAGLALSLVLTYVINKAFFGWSIQYSVPWMTVLATPGWILPAALLAGWIPAVRAGRVAISSAIRAE